MGSIMDTPFSTSIPIISTNLTSNDVSNPSSSTHWVESRQDYDPLEKVGYKQGDRNEYGKGFLSLSMRFSNKQTMWFNLPLKMSTSFRQSHMGENVLLNRYTWMKTHCIPWKVRYVNAQSITIVQKFLNNFLSLGIYANYFYVCQDLGV